MITTPLDEIRETYDVVVVGSGAAGLVAAVRAAEAGLTVLVLEKADRLGGTSAVGGGVMWSPCNHLMEREGFRDSAEDARNYLRAAADGRMSQEEIDWYVGTAPSAVRFLDERTRVRFNRWRVRITTPSGPGRPPAGGDWTTSPSTPVRSRNSRMCCESRPTFRLSV